MSNTKRNNLNILNSVALKGLFGINKTIYGKIKGNTLKLILAGVVGLILLVAICAASFSYSLMLHMVFSAAGCPQMVIAIMVVVSSFIMLLTTIYKVNGFVFGCKDYDMTMSMPIKVSTIVISKFATLYIMNILFEIVCIIPAAIVYSMHETVGPVFFVLLVIALVFIPFIPITLAIILGTLVTWISSKFQKAKKIEIIINILLFSSILIGYMKIARVQANDEMIANFGASLASVLYKIYPCAKWLINGIINSNYGLYFAFIGLSVVVFGVMVYFITRGYKKINTAVTTTSTNKNYKFRGAKTNTPFKSLFSRELKLYTSSNVYVVNTLAGDIMMVIAIGFLLFTPNITEKIQSLGLAPSVQSNLLCLTPFLLGFIVAMTCTTCCSVSMEGKSFWIIKSLPIATKDILISKVLLNLLLTVPVSLLGSIVIIFKLGLTGLSIFNAILLPIGVSVAMSILGLIINIMLPVLNWDSDVKVVKQSMSTLISLLGGMVFSIVIAVPSFFITAIPTATVVFITTLVVLLLAFLLYEVLTKVSVKAFLKIY